jgi:hypothetical protein
LRNLNASNDLSLTYLSGMPNSIISMSLQNCNINYLQTLQTTSASYLNCSNNKLSSLPTLPTSMSYIDCSDNTSMTSFPLRMPEGLQYLFAENLAISTSPGYFPNTIISMSFASCGNLNSWVAALPQNLAWLDVSNTLIESLPYISPPLKYLDVSNCNLSQTGLDNIMTWLVANGQTYGYLDISGNPNINYSSATLLTNVATLTARSWSVSSP